jgi:type IX secretion system PorP/SprF family membrane protein
MKKTLITAALMICIGATLWAQQLPLTSQLYFMRMLYNPALTAYNGSTNIYLFDREQWTAMPGHPSTRGGMGEISLWGDRSGVGIHVVDDITSVINTVNAQLYYAQKIKLAKDHHLSLGVSFGLMQTRIDYSNLVANDVSDPHLLGAARSGLAFDMNVGLAYQWKKLTVSFAVEHAANSNVTIADQLKNTNYDMQRHYIGGISYEFSFKNEKWNLEPSVLLKKGSGKPIQVDANIMANYKRFLYLGIGYRLDYGASVQAAVRIGRCVTIGYAYEYPIISHVSFGSTGGTHEVLLGINFDRWIKNDELKKQKKRLDSLEAQVRELKHTDTVLADRIDSLQDKTKQVAAEADGTKEAQKAQEQQIQDLTGRVDSLENQLKDYKDLVKKRPVTPFPAGFDNVNKDDIYKMDKIYFQTNSSYLKDESLPQLNNLLELLRTNPGMTIRVLGHTDYIASDTYNMWLSERRAKRVSDYLISNGIPAANVSAVGYGKRLPVADNATEEGRALNRRVEIQIIKK